MRMGRSKQRGGAAAGGSLASTALAAAMMAVLVAGAAAEALAGDAILLPPAELAAHRFVAEVDDATAVFLNPAGIGVITGNNLFLSVAGYDGDLDEFSVGVEGGVVAAGYRHHGLETAPAGVEPLPSVDPFFSPSPRTDVNFDVYTVAAGLGPRWFRAGLAFERITSDLPGDDASCWRVGIRSRPHAVISVGATVDHLDRPSFLSGELGTAYTYGLALRPIPGRPEWLALNAEGSHLDGDGRINLAYGARLLTRRGLELALLVRDDNGEDPQVGFRVTAHLGAASAEAGFRSVTGRSSDLRWHAAGRLYDDHWRRARAPREYMGS